VNWRKYLDFEEKEGGDYHRIVKLYERAVIACANYPEFWLRFSSYVEPHDSVAAEEILSRAALKFVKRRPEISFAYASLLELNGKSEEARHVYENVLAKIAPGLLEGAIRFANFERRQGNLQAADDLLSQSLSTIDSKSVAYLSAFYARFLAEIRRDPERTRRTYEVGVSKAPTSKTLWQAYINFELTQSGDDLESRVDPLYDRALGADLSTEDKTDLWQQRLEYLADRGSSISSVLKAEAAWKTAAAALGVDRKAKSRKRSAEDSGTPNKQQKTGYGATPSSAAAYAAQSAYPASASSAAQSAYNQPAAYSQQAAAAAYQNYGYSVPTGYTAPAPSTAASTAASAAYSAAAYPPAAAYSYPPTAYSGAATASTPAYSYPPAASYAYGYAKQ